MHTHTHAHTDIPIHVHILVHSHRCTHAHTYRLMHTTCTYTHTHAHTHTHAPNTGAHTYAQFDERFWVRLYIYICTYKKKHVDQSLSAPAVGTQQLASGVQSSHVLQVNECAIGKPELSLKLLLCLLRIHIIREYNVNKNHFRLHNYLFSSCSQIRP